MALISCPECAKEISDKVKSCPHCGYPLVEETDITQKVELTSVNVKIEEGKKKKVIKKIGILILVLAVISGGFWAYKKNEAKKAAIVYAEALETYRTNINLVTAEMLSSGVESEELMNLTYKVWRNAIYKEHDSETDNYTKYSGSGDWVSDFNVALNLLFLNYDTTTKVEKIEKSKKKIERDIKELQNPPEEYSKVYELLLDLYSVHQGVTDLAVNPKGNLQSFAESKNEKIDKFLEIYKKIETQLPKE